MFLFTFRLTGDEMETFLYVNKNRTYILFVRVLYIHAGNTTARCAFKDTGVCDCISVTVLPLTSSPCVFRTEEMVKTPHAKNELISYREVNQIN